MRVFSGLIDQMINRFAPPSFAAQPAPAIDFVPAAAVRAAVDDYALTDQAAYRQHLPLIIGHAQPALLARLAQLAPMIPAASTNVFGTCLPQHFDHALDVVQNKVRRKMRWHGHVENPSYATALRQEFVAVAHAIAGWDKQHFGAQSKIDIEVQHEQIASTSGRHKGISGGWHRDMLQLGEDEQPRLYFWRTNMATEFVPNRLTENVAVSKTWQPPVMPLSQDGAVVLVTGGENGTVHRAQRPPTGAPTQPSLFMIVAITP